MLANIKNCDWETVICVICCVVLGVCVCVCDYLVGSLQRRASVHVIFWFEDIHHFIGVEFEHALHLHVVRAFFPASILHLLLLRLTVTLTLTDPPQVPTETEEDGDDKPIIINEYWPLWTSLLHENSQDSGSSGVRGQRSGITNAPWQEHRLLRQMLPHVWRCEISRQIPHHVIRPALHTWAWQQGKMYYILKAFY